MPRRRWTAGARAAAEITALWQTDDVRSERPAVRDEVRMALDYYDASLFDTLPALYDEVRWRLTESTALTLPAWRELPRWCDFGSRGLAATATATRS